MDFFSWGLAGIVFSSMYVIYIQPLGPLWVLPLLAPLGPCGRLGPLWAGRLRAPLCYCGLGPCGPLGPFGPGLLGTLSACGLGPCGHSWVVVGRALVGSWTILGRALMGPLGAVGGSLVGPAGSCWARPLWPPEPLRCDEPL